MSRAAGAVRRLSPLAVHASVQILTQALGFVAGLLVVRDLTVRDYSAYSICVLFVAALAVVSDSGLSAMLLSRGAALLGSRAELSVLWRVGMRYRWRVAGLLIVFGVSWIVVLLWNNGEPPLRIAVYVALVVLVVAPQFTLALYQVLFRLTYEITLLRVINIGSAVLRVIAVAVLALLSGLDGVTALAVTAAVAAAAVLYARNRARKHIDLRPAAHAGVEEDLTGAFRRSGRSTMPALVALVIAEQVYVGVLAVRGYPELVGISSALSRFAILFGVLDTVVADMVAPRVARLTGTAGHVLRRVAAVSVGYVAVSGALVALIAVFAQPLTALLGTEYDEYTREFVLYGVAYALGSFGYALGSLNQSRGWIAGNWVYLPVVGAWLLWALLLAPVADPADAAALLILQVACLPATQVVCALVGFARSRRAERALQAAEATV